MRIFKQFYEIAQGSNITGDSNNCEPVDAELFDLENSARENRASSSNNASGDERDSDAVSPTVERRQALTRCNANVSNKLRINKQTVLK